MARVLVTGITGFTGRYLSELLIDQGYEVYGLCRNMTEDLSIDVANCFVCDLASIEDLKFYVQKIKPHHIVHLAGASFVANPNKELIYRVNFTYSRNLLEAIRVSGLVLDSVLLCSSANVYGSLAEGVLFESSDLKPQNDYGVSKVAMEYLAALYMNDLPIIIVRPFNYSGIGQDVNFLIPKIVSHFKAKKEFIELGNLEVVRDFTDVRTVVSIYSLLLNSPSAVGSTLNVCSGKPTSLREIIQMCASISNHEIRVVVNPDFVRDDEIKFLVGSNKLIYSIIDKPVQLSFRETLEWMIQG